ncbi:hypothetical protein LF1_37440 [Rubripirellula obstinata]|uniref:Uncharacterized protein n=1 Tax=Rubripirellula obstinata TaxID=406547 RepID=A0A5B1CJC2_9BACT|nr:hypothetical protein [Rubripirellula obstinata]KAA1261198.1 hypothetical protein LF1_37440 [Rubripirellula obstinata]
MKSTFRTRSLIASLAIAALTFGSLQAQDKDGKKAAIAKAKPVARAVASTPKIRPLSVSVDLLSKTRLEGTLTDATTLEMQTSFGGASIPLSEVAGIRFASAENASTTVVMLNGDSITGATDVKLVTVETEWGTATINGSNISSIMFVPGLDWNPASGLNGKRWNLINEKTAVKPKTTTVPATSSNGRTMAPPAPRQSYPSNIQPSQIYRTR